MGSNIVLFGWKRSIPGREKVSAQHFTEFVQYLGGLQQNGAIQTFETVFLDVHGGDLNGFVLGFTGVTNGTVWTSLVCGAGGGTLTSGANFNSNLSNL